MKKLISMLILSLGLSQVAFSAKTEVAATQAEKTVEPKTILGWMKNHPKTTLAIVTAAAAAGTAGVVYFCPENSASKFIKEKAISAKDTIVALPAQAWNFSKKHYIAVPAGVVTTIVLAMYAETLRGEKSVVKKALFGKQAEENKAVTDALVQ